MAPISGEKEEITFFLFFTVGLVSHEVIYADTTPIFTSAHVPFETIPAIRLTNSEQEVEIQSSGTIRCMMHWRFQRGEMLEVELLPTNRAMKLKSSPNPMERCKVP